MPQLSVIIVNYNVKYFLEQCLCSVLKACRHIDAEIFVVDNYSTDGSRAFFEGRFNEVQFIWKSKNEGFGRANNEAFKLAKGELILFLNPDTLVAEDCLELCIHFYQQQKNAGALGVHMIDGSGMYLRESKRGFPSLFTSFCKMTGLTRLFPRSKFFARYYLGHLPETDTQQVDVISGAFMLISKNVLEAVGSFDEQFFMYGEDIDLSYRIQKAGYINYYFAGTSIVHFKGESTAKNSSSYIQHFYGAMLLFIQKHYGWLKGKLYSLFVHVVIFLKKAGAKNKNTDKSEQSFLYDRAGIFCAESMITVERVSIHFKKIELIEEKQLAATAPAALIFCEACTSFKAIINMMQQHCGHFDFFIHASTTKSIVGSNDKNKSGVALPL
ncbi:MAG TPA: glycosyltransferase family 2 protein [Ferruginibacter sp.]|nr:glycosyltransferase family 2 protein [Ferruginibacter sp.]HMP19861.1 glycosyltransferase family 2 protein [Ferruginibacter sp.]